MTDTLAPADERWAVVLVHGVGDTEPADMIDSVAPVVSAVQDPTRQPSDQYELVRLADEGKKTFPVFMRRDRVQAARVLFAEVFWADLSRIREGTLALFVGLFYLIFGVRHIADQGSAQPGRPAAVLRVLLRIAAFLLRGPMFALYTLATSYSLVYLVSEAFRRYGWAVDFRAAPAAPIVFGAVGAAAVVVGLTAAWFTRRSHFFTAPPWTSLAVVGLLAAGLAALVLNQPGADILGLLLQAVHHEYPIIQGVGEAEFYAAAAELAADYVLWIVAGLLLAALAPLAVAWLGGRKDLRAALAAAYLAGAMQTLLWVLAVTPLDFLVVGAVTFRQPPGAAGPYWNDLYQYFTFQSVLIVAIAIVAVGVLLYRFVWSWRHKPADWPKRQEPRMIVADALECMVLAASCVFFVFTLVVPFTDRFDWFFPPALASILLWLVVVGLIAAVHLSPGPFRNVTHIIMDVINHFRTKGARFPVRERIAHRFASVLQHVLAKEKPTHLLVIAHSQGTVITLDALGRPVCQAALERAALPPENVRLATFGSPYSHLYQHYFPDQYPPRPGHVILGPAFGRWVNAFRIDDYVGTQVNGEPDVDRPTNIPLKVGYLAAHTNYWQADVFECIKDLLPGAPVPAPPPAP